MSHGAATLAPTARRRPARWLFVLPLLLLAAAPARAGGFDVIRHAIVDGVEEAYVRYESLDGTPVVGWLFVNPFSDDDTEPCVIFNHGGVSGVSEGTRIVCRKIAKEGYIVFAPSYRGEDDSGGEIEVAMGEVDDVLAALLLLRDHPGVVPGQFALLGASHGALVSVKALARPEARELVKAVVAAYGVMDIYAWYQYLLDNDFDVRDPLSLRVYGEGPQDKPQAFADRHALSLVDQLAPAPLLLVQGEQDRIVPAQQARTMIDALRAAGRERDRALFYEHGAHGLLYWDDPARHSEERLADAARVWEDIFAFLATHLRREGQPVGPTLPAGGR